MVLKFDWNILFTFINLLVFFLLMKKFLFGRIQRVIEARRALLKKQFDEAQQKKTQAEEMLADYEKRLAHYEAEGEQIISEATQKAKVEYRRILEKADADADKLKAEAEKEIRKETERARNEAKESLAALAIEAAEKVVGESVSAQMNSDIFDDFLNEGSNG